MSDEGFALDTSLAFDKRKQSAIVGWALEDSLFFTQLAHSVKPEWFASSYVQKIFGAMLSIYNQHHRLVTPDEIVEWRGFNKEDAKSKQRIGETLVECIQMTSRYGLDLLRAEMTDWMHSVIYFQAVKQSSLLYNSFKTKDAWRVMEDAVMLKTTSSFEEGTNEGFLGSEGRILSEREERIAQSKRILSFGVDFLDDTLGGIIPNDLIVLGAKTGAGKTQLATSIALYNAGKIQPDATGKNKYVHYFALEAENNEIERRIKYGFLAGEYYDGNAKSPISYTDWRMGKIDGIMKPLEEKILDKYTKAVKNLKTLYRNSGIFDLKVLERSLLSVVAESRLIVIDHLHYVDTDEDENLGYKRTIKIIRDIVLRFGVPIIVIAHVRKGGMGRHNSSLINSIEDFHGTSDIPKIATTCIMLAPAYDHKMPDRPNIRPTYMQVVKSRLDGSRCMFTGLSFFDTSTTRYISGYRIGRMKDFNSSWDQLHQKNVPCWAVNHDSSMVTVGYDEDIPEEKEDEVLQADDFHKSYSGRCPEDEGE